MNNIAILRAIGFSLGLLVPSVVGLGMEMPSPMGPAPGMPSGDVQILIEQLRSDDAGERSNASQKLIEMGESVRSAVAAAEHQGAKEIDLRAQVNQVLEGIDTKVRSDAALRTMEFDPQNKKDPKLNRERILKLLQDPSRKAFKDLLLAAGIGVFPALRYTDEENGVTNAPLEIRCVKEVVNDPQSGSVSLEGAAAIAALFLNHSKATARKNAIEAMAVFAWQAQEKKERAEEMGRKHAGRVAELMQDSRMEVREAAAWALIYLRDSSKPALILNLVGGLKDKESQVRFQALNTLGLLGDPSSVRAIEPLVKDADERVRKEAVQALDRIRSNEPGRGQPAKSTAGKAGDAKP